MLKKQGGCVKTNIRLLFVSIYEKDNVYFIGYLR